MLLPNPVELERVIEAVSARGGSYCMPTSSGCSLQVTREQRHGTIDYCIAEKWDGRIRISFFFPTFSPASAHCTKYIKTSTKRTPVLQLCVWMAVTILSHSVPSLKPTVDVDAMICVRRCTNAYGNITCINRYILSIRICSSVVTFS